MRQFISILKDRFCCPVRGVEVGVERGDNAVDILRALPVDLLSLVDIWRPFIQEGAGVWNTEICEANYHHVMKRFADDIGVTVEVLRMSSLEAAARFKQDLDFVYIDACHQYEYVVQDIQAWLPKIRRGGLLCGHDYTEVFWPGVVRAVNEFFPAAQHGHSGNDNADDWWVEV